MVEADEVTIAMATETDSLGDTIVRLDETLRSLQKSVESLTYATGALNENSRTVKDEISSFRSEVTSRFSGLHEHLELGRKDLYERASHLDDRLNRLDGALTERFDRLERQLLR